MKKYRAVFLLILTAALCLAAQGLAVVTNWDAAQGTKHKITVIPDRVQAGDTVMVNITLKNNTEEDFLSPVVLLDPDGNRVEDFDEVILKAGGSVSWSGFWRVTEAQMEDFGIRYTVTYRYRDREGKEKDVSKMLRAQIVPEAKRTSEPTPETTPEPTPRPEERPRIFLYSVLKPNTEIGIVGLCCIDEAGDIWSVQNADIYYPYTEEDILQALLERRGMKLNGNLNDPRYYDGEYSETGLTGDLKGMAAAVKKADGNPEPTGYDLDENAVYALQYDRNGNPEPVLLGTCGGAVFENRDPNAQALYEFMWRNQYLDTPCGFAQEGLTPRGFEIISVREFFGLEKADTGRVTVTAALQDCEAGPIEMRLTEEDREAALAILERGIIIRKENDWMVTGGTVCYSFLDEEGEYLGTIELYNGLAVGRDGMYRLSLLPESTEKLDETEKQMLRLNIAGAEYELGKSTPRDLIRNGWYCLRESDGFYTFTDNEGYGEFYVFTTGGSVDEPIIAIHCQFAYTIPFEYCGFDGHVDPDDPEDMDTVWRLKYLEKLKAYIRENGEDEDEYNLNVDPWKDHDEDEKGDGLYWTSLEEWILTLGKKEEDMDNGTSVRVELSDGHMLTLFTAESPVSLSLGYRK